MAAPSEEGLSDKLSKSDSTVDSTCHSTCENNGEKTATAAVSTGAFLLKSEEEVFKKKKDDIFGCLDALEVRHQNHVIARKKFGRESEESYMKSDPQPLPKIAKMDGKTWPKALGKECDYDMDDGIKVIKPPPKDGFRVPTGKAPKPKVVPGFSAHPDQWTKYDLSGVSSSDMSERSNTAAALDFLQEMNRSKIRKECERVEAEERSMTPEMPDEVDNEDAKVLFTKPNMSSSQDKSEKKTNPCVPVENSAVSGDAVGLSHLTDDNVSDVLTAEPSDNSLDAGIDVDVQKPSASKQLENVQFRKKARAKNIRVRDSEDRVEDD